MLMRYDKEEEDEEEEYERGGDDDDDEEDDKDLWLCRVSVWCINVATAKRSEEMKW